MKQKQNQTDITAVCYDSFQNDDMFFQEEPEYFWDVLNNSNYNAPCILTGGTYTEHGVFKIFPYIFDNISEAICHILSHGSCGIRIEQKHGFLEIHDTRHDGTDLFKIHLLNKKGAKLAEREKKIYEPIISQIITRK